VLTARCHWHAGRYHESSTMQGDESRRQFLKGTLSACTAAAVPSLLIGCGGGDPLNAEPTLEQKIAQMLIVGFRGTRVAASDPIVRDINVYGIGGTILFDRDVSLGQFGRNITSPQQLTELTGQLHAWAKSPLFIAIDQEGGRVARLKESYGFPATVTAQFLGTLNDLDVTRTYAHSMAATLQDNGLNMNFCPVVDLNVNPLSPAIGKLERSFSADPVTVINHTQVMIEAHDQRRIATCVKHFPGHGSATGDSHAGITDVTATWSEIELEPYRALIAHGRCRMVMTAHIFNRRLDPEYPSTLSYPTITGILRLRLGYDGVVVTDDMQMGAIIAQYSLETAVEKAIMAGIDIIMFANNLAYDPDIAPKVIAMVSRMVAAGTIPVERINASYRRIMAMKRTL
jgi:beta-N-acetylhexosaminidase